MPRQVPSRCLNAKGGASFVATIGSLAERESTRLSRPLATHTVDPSTATSVGSRPARSWSVGIVVSGVVMRNGMGAETLAWTVMFLLMPLTCVYYPVSVLPEWLQYVAWALPPT